MSSEALRLHFSEDRSFLYLTVYPRHLPAEGLSAEYLLDFLFESGFSSFEYQLDQRIVDELLAMPWKKVNQNLARCIAKRIEFYLSIELSSDEMMAWASLRPAFFGERISRERLIQRLHDLGVCYGLLDQALDDIVAEAFAEKVEIAHGQPAEHGRDSYIEFLLTPPISEPEVKALTPLARLHAPTVGHNGKTVTGRPVPALPGQAQVFMPGEGCQADPGDLGTIIASRDGIPIISSKSIRIDQLIRLQAADLSSEKYAHSLEIHGDLPRGVQLESLGHLIIYGDVEQGALIAGADLTILGQASGPLWLQSAGHLSAERISEALIYCGRDLKISQQLSHSQGYIVGSCLAPQAEISGGKLHVLNSLEVGQLGHTSGMRTEIHLGHDPYFDNHLQMLKAQQNKSESQLTQLLQQLIRARIEGRIVDELEQEQRQLYYQNMVCIQELQTFTNHLQVRLQAQLKIKRKLWQGVWLYSENQELEVKQDYPAFELRVSEGLLLPAV